MTSPLETLHTIRTALLARFVERDEVIDGLLAALLAGEHVLLLGPVGTAKSMLAHTLCKSIEGATYFGWLLTTFSTPEELFGPVSLSGLEQDDYRRVTTSKLPEAHIAFLDEIFKSNSAILNALLTLMNERVYHNGTAAQPVPLVTLVAASNELPEEGELAALFDRFLLRFVVDYIREDFRFIKMLSAPSEDEAPPIPSLRLDELEALRAQTRAVAIEERFLGDVAELRRRLLEKGIIASDRRFRKALRLMQAYALLDRRDAVTEPDLARLEHVLWSDPGEREELRMTIQELFRGHEEDARKLLVQAREIEAYAAREWGDAELAMRASIEAHTKLRKIASRAEDLLTNARERQRRVEEVEQVVESIHAIQREILSRSLEV